MKFLVVFTLCLLTINAAPKFSNQIQVNIKIFGNNLGQLEGNNIANCTDKVDNDGVIENSEEIGSDEDGHFVSEERVPINYVNSYNDDSIYEETNQEVINQYEDDDTVTEENRELIFGVNSHDVDIEDRDNTPQEDTNNYNFHVIHDLNNEDSGTAENTDKENSAEYDLWDITDDYLEQTDLADKVNYSQEGPNDNVYLEKEDEYPNEGLREDDNIMKVHNQNMDLENLDRYDVLLAEKDHYPNEEIVKADNIIKEHHQNIDLEDLEDLEDSEDLDDFDDGGFGFFGR